MSYLLTPKALDLIKSNPSFSASYSLVEGEYVYARDGRIVRVDAPARAAEATEEKPAVVMVASELSTVEAKKTKRSKNETTAFENDAFLTKNNNTDESKDTVR